jgi:hypothetical protein
MRGSSVVALPWFRRVDYAALLKLFTDSEKLPGSFEVWRQRAEAVERQSRKAGFTVAYNNEASPFRDAAAFVLPGAAMILQRTRDDLGSGRYAYCV